MSEENDNRKPDAERRLAPVSLFGLTVGQPATLEENDCFGSTCNVVVLQIHKGGNVIVQDGNVKREVSARNLMPNNELCGTAVPETTNNTNSRTRQRSQK